MTGTLDDTHLNALEQEQNIQGRRTTLFDYAANDAVDATTIAVVSKPNDTGILEACDEHMPALGMPDDLLEEFQHLRSRVNEYTDEKEHNTAYERLELDRKYREYLKDDETAQRAVQEVVDRLQNGEDITLVCFEGPNKQCHRHVLKEHLRNQLREVEA